MKYYGKIGFVENVETVPGVWSDPNITERSYKGDVMQNFMRNEASQYVNDNINISNQISIVADPYAYQNFHHIKYIWYLGTKWKVMNVNVKYPRLELTVGGVYNE